MPNQFENFKKREEMKNIKPTPIEKKIPIEFIKEYEKYEKYEHIKTLEGHEGPVPSVIESHDGKYIISGSGDRTIKIWDKETGECIKTLEGHRDSVLSVIESHDGKYIISGSYDETIKIWGEKEE